MLMNALRVFLAILYSTAFIFSLSRCSPNAASLDKSVLRSLQQQSGSGHSGGIIVDANLKATQSALKFHFVSSAELRAATSDAKSAGEVRVPLLSNDSGTGSLDELKRTGETEISLENSTQLFPAEAWIRLGSKNAGEKANTEGCSLVVLPTHEGTWRVTLGESSDCKARQEILSRVEEILISFHAKESVHLVDSVTTSKSP